MAMASSLFASPRSLLLSPNPNKPLLLLSPPVSVSFSLSPRNPRLASLAALPIDAPGPDPDPDPSSIPIASPGPGGPDPASKPIGGRSEDPGPTGLRITDEWGEVAPPEPEAPSEPDPPKDEDEWGDDYAAGNGMPVPEDDKIGDLKRCLLDTLYGTELGFRASAEVRAEVFELVSQLEALNPTPAPNEAAELLDGNWVLLYTAFSELLPILAVGATPFLKVKKISQAIDTKTSTIINSTMLSSPFASFSFSASASFQIQTPSRIQVDFKEGTFQPPEISSTVDLPENFDVFGQKINLQPVRQALNPIQEAFANTARALSGQPPLKVPIPGNRSQSWLLTTYLDQDFRISRGDGGLFVLAKEGSPLLDQLA